MTGRAAVYSILDEFEGSRISGWDLFDLVYLKTGRRPYPHRLLAYARDWADASCGEFECVDRTRSIYKITKGYPIAGAILN